jgi:hypothetical protein
MNGQLQVLWCQQVIDVLVVQLQEQAAGKQDAVAAGVNTYGCASNSACITASLETCLVRRSCTNPIKICQLCCYTTHECYVQVHAPHHRRWQRFCRMLPLLLLLSCATYCSRLHTGNC